MKIFSKSTHKNQQLQWRPPLLVQFVMSVLLAVIPIGVVVAVFLQTLDKHMETTRFLVKQTNEITKKYSTLTEDLTNLELAIKKNWLLKDEQLEKTIEEKWLQVSFRVEAFAQLFYPQELSEHWHKIALQLNNLHQLIFAQKRQDNIFQALHDQLNHTDISIVNWKNSALQLQEKELDELQQEFIVWLIAIIPLSLLISGLFLWSISKQLRKLSSTINLLGAGQWLQPILMQGSAELIELGDRLEWMRNQLLSIEQQKNNFLRHVTHELKTPLASIIESTSLLKDEVVGPTTSQQQDILGLLEQSNLHLCGLIDNLLNYNAFQARKPASVANDLSVLPSKINQHFEQRLSVQQQHLHWDTSNDLKNVFVDIEQLEIVLIQLVSNALKFSPVDAIITISIRIIDNQLVIRVRDQGSGIPRDEEAHIFEAFYQGILGKSNRQKGNGLGLTIVKECVQLLKGNIEIQSEINIGSQITLIIPLNITD